MYGDINQVKACMVHREKRLSEKCWSINVWIVVGNE